MKYDLEASVIYQINSDFSEKEQDNVVEMLSFTKLWADFAGPPPRIHHAFLKLAKGNLKKLENILEHHAGDWRDALIRAGLGDDNWKEILRNKGIEPKEWKC